MDSVQTFLVHAIRLESAAAHRSDELADAMQTWGNREVEALFRKMAEYSREHLKDAMARAGFRLVVRNCRRTATTGPTASTRSRPTGGAWTA